jgi:hypothetical protein
VKFQPGDDVVIDFKGVEDVPGEVIRHSNGWVMLIADIDGTHDWGNIGPRLDPRSTICVPESRVKPAPNNS